jgi:hypothetical protein
VHDSAQRLHISAQGIIISSPFAIFSQMVAQLIHVSAHMPQTLEHMGLMSIIHFIAISHMPEQSCIRHIISADTEMPLLILIIIVSLHIAIQLQQSSMRRCISVYAPFSSWWFFQLVFPQAIGRERS